MLVINNVRRLLGFSAYGPPPVCLFELEIDEPSAPLPAAVLAGLSQGLGLEIHAAGAATEPDTEPAPICPIAAAFAATTTALLRRAGHRVGDGRLVEPARRGAAAVALPCEETESARQAGELAATLIEGMARGAPATGFGTAIAGFLDAARAHRVDSNARALRRRAMEKGLPVMWLDQFPFEPPPPGLPRGQGLLQIGQGVQAEIFAGPMPRIDGHVLALNSHRGTLFERLRSAGLPVPDHASGLNGLRTAGRAQSRAGQLGGPVIVRSVRRAPFAYRHPATAVYGPLHDGRQIERAFEAVLDASDAVWLERHLPGDLLRLLVIDGRVRAAGRKSACSIVGDGRSSVDELIAVQAQSLPDPSARRAWQELVEGDADSDTRLALAGFARDSVLPEGRRLALRADEAVDPAAAPEPVLDSLSPAIIALAEQAANACGLTALAGVDLRLASDPGRIDGQAVVVDVRPDPDLLELPFPESGHDPADMLITRRFPANRTGRIPLVAVTGTNGKTTTVRMIHHILGQRFDEVACATTVGAFAGDRCIDNRDVAGAVGASLVLAEPSVQAAVLETARGGLLIHGTAFDWCDVGVCLNVAEDHLGEYGIDTLDQLAGVKAEVIRRSRDLAVLNAHDPRVLAMHRSTPAERIALAGPGLDPETAWIDDERLALIVTTEPGDDGNERIVLHDRAERHELMRTSDLPASLGGAVGFNVENALFAVAAARGLGLGLETIRTGLESFEASREANPGRFNIYPGSDCRIVVDHAQNVHAMDRLGAAVGALEVAGSRRLLLRALGNRSDDEIRDLAFSAAASGYDHIVCTNYDLLRGRQLEEVPGLLHETLLAAGVPASAVEVIPDEDQAIDHLLDAARGDDLVVLIFLGGSHQAIWQRLDARYGVAS